MGWPLKNFLHYLTLKQGTVLIAIIQLLISAYFLVFFILGLSHVTGIQELIDRDTEDALEREALEDISSRHINSQRMELARHNATEQVFLMYWGLGITVNQFFTSILLLYGVLMNRRHCIAPWMMFMMTIIVALIITLFFFQEDNPFLALMGGKADIFDRFVIIFIVVIFIYAWLVVYSTYRSLEVKKGIIHEVHGVKSRSVRGDKKSKTKSTVPRPSEV